MKINSNAIRIGNVIEHGGKPWVVVKTMHTQPGKGGAFVQAELKSLTGNTKTTQRFRSAESVELVRLDAKPYQYLYKEENDLIFMDQETFEQISLSSDFVGDGANYLQDGIIINVCFYDDKPLSIELPSTVILRIAEADAVVKGQTASSSFKPAILENGLRTLVPPHIEAGTRVVINTEDGSYVERAKD
jgi:elongation factor P